MDRCLSSAYPMLLLKINYTKLQRRIIGTVFPVVCLITLPHLLGFTVTYHHGSHSMVVYCNDKDEICNLLSHRTSPDNDVPWTVMQCGNISDRQILSTSEALQLDHIPQLLDTWCNSTTESNSSVCKPVHAPADKFTPHLIAGLSLSRTKASNGTWINQRFVLSVCNSSTPTSMRHDPDFVKAVYLGIDLPLRYIYHPMSRIGGHQHTAARGCVPSSKTTQTNHWRHISGVSAGSSRPEKRGSYHSGVFRVSHRGFGHIHYRHNARSLRQDT